MASAPEPVPEVLEGQVPFDETVYTESDGNETFYTDSVRTEFTPAVINGRKLTLRFMSEMEIGRERIRDAELTEDVECGEPLCRKKRTINLLKLAVSKKDTYRIREEVSLPGTKESIGKVLVSDVSLRRLISGPARTRYICAENCSFSVCICRPWRRQTGWSRACPLKDGSSATASRKICTTISGMS